MSDFITVLSIATLVACTVYFVKEYLIPLVSHKDKQLAKIMVELLLEDGFNPKKIKFAKNEVIALVGKGSMIKIGFKRFYKLKGVEGVVDLALGISERTTDKEKKEIVAAIEKTLALLKGCTDSAYAAATFAKMLKDLDKKYEKIYRPEFDTMVK